MEKAGLLRRPFYPIFWMTSRHLQTVMGSVFSDLFWLLKPPVEYRREAVTAHDGSVLHLDWSPWGIGAREGCACILRATLALLVEPDGVRTVLCSVLKGGL